MFDGISCGHVALERAGIKVDKYYASEIDKYAIQIAQKNYPDTLHIGDVNDIDFNEYIEKIDMLIGGSPCTFWSISKQNREVDKEGIGWKLFSRYIDALKTVKPKYFLYENVASMPQSIKSFISEEFSCEPILINSALVSAQKRKRLYWTNIPNVRQPEDKNILLQDILEDGYVDRDKSFCLDACYYKGGNLKQYFDKSRRQIVFRSLKDYKFCKTNYKNINIKSGEEWRHLTPIECERLQGLEDNYTDGVSNTQRYKMIGNGWNVDTIVHILKNIT